MGKVFRKIISIILIITLLINSNEGLFAQSISSGEIDKRMFKEIGKIEEEIVGKGERILEEQEKEAMGILQGMREELAKRYQEDEEGSKSLEDEVVKMVKLF